MRSSAEIINIADNNSGFPQKIVTDDKKLVFNVKSAPKGNDNPLCR
jgi:hypothetical protein